MTINAFFGVISHLNSLKTHPERITKADQNMVNDFANEGIEGNNLKNRLLKY